jgi:hypothetical protein
MVIDVVVRKRRLIFFVFGEVSSSSKTEEKIYLSFFTSEFHSAGHPYRVLYLSSGLEIFFPIWNSTQKSTMPVPIRKKKPPGIGSLFKIG